MAVRRHVPGRHPAAHPARPARRLAADRAISPSPTRMRAPSTWRIPTCSRSTASPATTAGRTASRVTYGVDWALDLPGIAIRTNVGQSYRLDRDDRRIFPDGTGLSGRFSDIVGRTERAVRQTVSVTHRFRLDKDNLAVRRNEVDATIGVARDLCSASAISGSTATSTQRSRICGPRGGPRRRPACSSRATGRCSARRWSI